MVWELNANRRTLILIRDGETYRLHTMYLSEVPSGTVYASTMPQMVHDLTSLRFDEVLVAEQPSTPRTEGRSGILGFNYIRPFRGKHTGDITL